MHWVFQSTSGKLVRNSISWTGINDASRRKQQGAFVRLHITGPYTLGGSRRGCRVACGGRFRVPIVL